MEDFEIVSWPDIQELMKLEGFDENATLIESNYNIGIDDCTYLVSKEWLETLEEEGDENESNTY